MDFHHFFTKGYEILRDYKYIWSKLLTPVRVLFRYSGNVFLPQYFKRTPLHYKQIDNRIVVSLTSFPARINKVWLSIQSLKRQTIAPGKIVLWLSKLQFPNIGMLPDSLTSLRDEIFDIVLVDDDLKSHKKFFYVFQQFNDKLIITADDDIIYTPDTIERLLSAYKKQPDCIYCCFGLDIKYDNPSTVSGYNHWSDINYSQSTKSDVFFGSGGGTLFPPGSLYQDVCRRDLFMSLTPSADDVWLNAMARLKGTKIIKIPFGMLFPIISKGDSTLCDINVSQNQNDVQIKNICTYYLNFLGESPF